ncbi:MAG: DUF2314 domain-containing protein [Spirochaetaceae bacterium]|jgi:uncharacterized protein YegJ (DUF2314 family)|nr:DUF2314 domain-containing protein [Spirochaetaceae bacterium]
MGKLPGILLLFAVLLFSCEKKAQIPAAIPRDPTLALSQSDEILREISLRAREELPVFIRKMQNPGLGEGDFMVKHPFPADERSGFRYEELWLGEIRFDHGRYSGVLVNQPYHISAYKAGDRVFFAIDDISDWMYTQDGQIIGGDSIRYLIEGIPELDRDAATSAWYERFVPSSAYP